MGKPKTSKKQKSSKSYTLIEYVPFSDPDFMDVDLVIETLLECIRVGDMDSFKGVLFSHLMTVNKAKLAKKAGIGRRTLYDLIDPKKEFNPELSTVTAIFRALAA